MNTPANARRSRAAKISMVAIVLAGLTGCVPLGKEFREAATPAVHTGLTQIVNGLLDGIFATIEPDTTGLTTEP